MAASVSIRPIAAADTYALRQQVLWPAMPLDYVKIADDAAGRHYGAFLGEELVAVISLFVQDAQARFRKFATRPDCQGRGLGSALLRHVFGQARALGARHISCDARLDSAGFYARFGMEPAGSTFHKGSVAYVRMSCAL